MAAAPKIAASMRRDALLASPFFRSMHAEELDEIIGFATERRIARNTVIFHKGDPGSYMMSVLAGRVRASNVSADGREVTLNVIGPGELLGEIALLDGKPRSSDVTTIEDSTLLVIERRHFFPFLLRHESLIERLLVVLCDRLRRTSLALEELALFELPARLARLLLKLATDYGRALPEGGTRIDLKLSQRELSSLVASSRETVNKQLRIWRASGAIALTDGYLVLLRPAELQALLE